MSRKSVRFKGTKSLAISTTIILGGKKLLERVTSDKVPAGKNDSSRPTRVLEYEVWATISGWPIDRVRVE